MGHEKFKCDVENLHLSEGDIVVGKVNNGLSCADVDELGAALTQILKDSNKNNEVIVLNRDIELDTLSDDKLKALGLKKILYSCDKETIIICDRCKGSGKTEDSEIEDYHHNTYFKWDEVCSYCGGQGRVVKEITTAERKLTEKDLRLEGGKPPRRVKKP